MSRYYSPVTTPDAIRGEADTVPRARATLFFTVASTVRRFFAVN
jgi:hypothetical protein